MIKIESMYTDEWIDYRNDASRKLLKLPLRNIQENLSMDILRFWLVVKYNEWSFKRNKNSSCLFHIVINGCCKVVTDDGEFYVKKGEFFLPPPEVFHQPSLVGDETLVMYYVDFDLKLLNYTPTEESQILSLITNAAFMPYKNTEKLDEICEEIFREAYEGKLGHCNTIKNLFFKLLVSFARCMLGNKDFKQFIPIKDTKNYERLLRIQKYVEANINMPISIKDLSNHLFLGEKQIGRIIMNEKGYSTKEYIERIKIQKAKEMLKDNKLSISEISEKLGFSSQSYFVQSYKRIELMSPSKFRKIVSIID